MATEQTQSFSSHTRWYPLYHFVASPILLLNVFAATWHAIRIPTNWNIWLVVVSVGLAATAWTARGMALRVQDRVIRLEMRLRFSTVLPAPLAARAMALPPRQLVELRFASDAELPTLVERCLAGELNGRSEIKKAIKNWQADWLRA